MTEEIANHDSIPILHSKHHYIDCFLRTSFADFLLATRGWGETIPPENNNGQHKSFLEFIAKEIAAEHSLVTARMTWNLSFQGFLFAGYALALSRLDSPGKPNLVIENFFDVLAFAGIMTSASCLLGVLAAFTQINALKRLWYKNHEALTKVGPRPFSHWLGGLAGRVPPIVITTVIIIAWVKLSI